PQDLDTVHLGHEQVQQDQVGRLVVEEGESFGTVSRTEHLEAKADQELPQDGAKIRLVVNDERELARPGMRVVDHEGELAASFMLTLLYQPSRSDRATFRCRPSCVPRAEVGILKPESR